MKGNFGIAAVNVCIADPTGVDSEFTRFPEPLGPFVRFDRDDSLLVLAIRVADRPDTTLHEIVEETFPRAVERFQMLENLRQTESALGRDMRA